MFRGQGCYYHTWDHMTAHMIMTTSSLFSWQSGGWSSCSQECGPGKRLRNVGLYRFEEEGRKPVAVVDTALYTLSKPAQEEQCNIRNCSANWISGVWTEVRMCVVRFGG